MKLNKRKVILFIIINCIILVVFFGGFYLGKVLGKCLVNSIVLEYMICENSEQSVVDPRNRPNIKIK